MSDATDLYRYFDADDRLLYVGISFSAVMRASQHRSDKGWWKDVARMTVEHLPNRAAAERKEIEAIKNESPVHNVVWNDGRPTPKPKGLSEQAQEWIDKWLSEISRVVISTAEFELCDECTHEVGGALNRIWDKNSPKRGQFSVPMAHWINARHLDNCSSSNHEPAGSNKTIEGLLVNLLAALDEADVIMAEVADVDTAKDFAA